MNSNLTSLRASINDDIVRPNIPKLDLDPPRQSILLRHSPSHSKEFGEISPLKPSSPTSKLLSKGSGGGG